MPWCEACDEVFGDDELSGDGFCPSCGGEMREHRPSPWYFKFMVVATVIYLAYRAYQGINWVAHHVHG